MRKALPFFVGVTMLLAASVAPLVPGTFAHCPETPYDTTVFAPITPQGGFPLGLEIAANGLTAPLKAITAPGQQSHLFVVDQPGQLWSVNLTTSTKTLVLNVSGRLVTLGVLGPNTFDERGFLGVAFHPNYQQNGLLYTYTSEPNAGPPTLPTTIPPGSTADHQNVVAEWRVATPSNPSAAVNPASRRELLRVDWPQFNHDGGDMAFGPDGNLYISMGDGGGADDSDGQLFIKATGSLPAVNVPIIGHQGDGNAQKLNTPLGKVLRINVAGNDSANGQYGIPADNPFVGIAGTVAEIYAFGLRNPFRFSFDGSTLYLGDVGQNDIEEVDVIVKGGNYGWNHREGTLFFHINGTDEGFASTTPDDRLSPANLIAPIAQYDIHHEGHSVIGGFVYHGTRFPQLRGRYVFGEFSRVFNFPSGPHNYGRVLYIQHKNPTDKLQPIHEFKGFSEAISAVGLSVGGPGCTASGAFPPTLAVLGMGQDASGEIYVMGNITGVPFGDGGVVLRIVPKRG